MTEELAGAADIATGAVIARAIEPEAGKDGHFHEGTCLNCGTVLMGAYCHGCGQQGHLHRTLTAFFHDLAHGVLHLDGKIWRTLPLLAWRPGELTRRYVHGERVRFVSPLALFLFSAFLMFAVLSIMGRHLEAPEDLRLNGGEQVAKGVRQGSADLRKELTAIDAKIAAGEAEGRNTGELRREKANVSGMLRMLEGGPVVLTNDDGKKITEFETGWARLDKGIKKANENPNLLLYKLQSNAYKFSWMLIPISVPFVWLLFFWRRRFKIYDHAIFVTYSLSFMTILATVMTILAYWGLPIQVIAPLLTFIIPVHIYKQLKYAYGISRFGALMRTFLLLVSGSIVSMLFILLLLGLGILG